MSTSRSVLSLAAGRRAVFIGLSSCFCAVLAACQAPPPPSWSGYVEAEYLYISAPIGGKIDRIMVEAGQEVAANSLLFKLDQEAEEASSAEAQARVAAAQALLANASKGRRKEEIAITEAQLQSAQAQVQLAQTDLIREQQLLAQGFISKARLDDISTKLTLYQAKVSELKAALDVARLPSRNDERDAARANVQAADQTRRLANWRLTQKSAVAPASGVITEVFFRKGEVVNAGQAVLSLLPPTHLKFRFFIAEAELATLLPGHAIQVSCDACGAPIDAHVSRIASQAEYTPPVIYSNAQRAKLLFMVEAKPDHPSTALHPGQPISVRLRPSTRAKS